MGGGGGSFGGGTLDSHDMTHDPGPKNKSSTLWPWTSTFFLEDHPMTCKWLVDVRIAPIYKPKKGHLDGESPQLGDKNDHHGY